MKELGEISLRMVKILLENGSIEVLATNLSQTEFHTEEIKELYHMDATEKLFLHTIYSLSRLIDVLYFVLIYTQKGLFQWPSYEVGIKRLRMKR